MNLLGIIERNPAPLPWEEGDNIPWHDPGFSERMLAEHLSQLHDRASRRSHIVDAHVAWIHHDLLCEQPTSILDLGCGPGLYSNRLARLGHRCTGIDYSPASIRYAQERANEAALACTYHLADIRNADYQPVPKDGTQGYGLIMLLYGELNIFPPAHAAAILAKCYAALAPAGLLLLEPHTYQALQPSQTPCTWYSSRAGPFSPSPHLVLMAQSWHEAQAVLTIRYYVIDAATAAVTRYAQSMQCYTEVQYRELLQAAGFHTIDFLPGLAYDQVTPMPELCAIVARK